MAFIREFGRGDPGIGSWLKKAAKIVMPASYLANSRHGMRVGVNLLPGAGAVAAGVGRAGLLKAIGAKILGKIGPGMGGGLMGAGRAILQGAGSTIGAQAMQRLTGQTGVTVTDPVTGYEYVDYTKKKRRRMNVANLYALRRSVRRVKGFAKIARQSLTLDKKFKNKAGLAPRRKRRA